jgi:hypothetical protein
VTTRQERLERAAGAPATEGASTPARQAAAARKAARTSDASTRTVRGRLARLSLPGTMGAGAWVGFAIGLTIGALLGALIAWLAGALVSWQRDLAFTLGVATRLLPLGDQSELLRDLNTRWYLTVPVAGLVGALFGALLGALLAGILAAAYNRSPRKASVDVDLPHDAAK